MKKFFYFISYAWDNGHGMCEVERTAPITQYSELRNIAGLLAKKEKSRDIIIVNYQLLRSEEVKDDSGINIDLSWLGKDSGIEE